MDANRCAIQFSTFSLALAKSLNPSDAPLQFSNFQIIKSSNLLLLKISVYNLCLCSSETFGKLFKASLLYSVYGLEFL